MADIKTEKQKVKELTDKLESETEQNEPEKSAEKLELGDMDVIDLGDEKD